MIKGRDEGWSTARWATILVASICVLVVVCSAQFVGAFRSFVPVSLTADRSGLVMEPGAKVKMRGVVVGRVADISGGGASANLRLELLPDEVAKIPGNVHARIEASTAFGAKYVDLIVPQHPSPKHIQAGAQLTSANVSTEVNTVFESLVKLIDQVDPAKMNATLTALSEGLRGRGEAIGQAITDADDVLRALNARTDTIRSDFRSLRGFTDAYSRAAGDILATLDAASTTAATVSTNAPALDSLLLNVIGLTHAGSELLAPNQGNLVTAVNTLAPTTDLLLKYNPTYTCLLLGTEWLLDNGAISGAGGNGYSSIVDTALLFGKDIYRYPENLPKVNAKGGPGGKPSCGSLPNAELAFPVKQLVADTGWGTNPNDIRTNPGFGHPFYVDYLPVTRGVPKDPSFRGSGPPAPGPVTPPPPAPPLPNESPAP